MLLMSKTVLDWLSQIPKIFSNIKSKLLGSMSEFSLSILIPTVSSISPKEALKWKQDGKCTGEK
jgi:hypothetical protein